MKHQYVIRNGRVALSDGWAELDIGIDDGRISALSRGLSGFQTIDASDKWVLPGGIDAHCHLDQPSWGGADTADDFLSGSVSAAFGGTTCIVPFAMPGPNMTSLDALDRSLKRSKGRSYIDYGLHGVLTNDTGTEVAQQVQTLVKRGVPTVKVFMTYQGFAVDDMLMLSVMDAARSVGATVMVHAENDAAILRTRQKLLEKDQDAFRFHAVANAMAMEREATHRAAALAEVTGARVVVLHVSGQQSADEVERGRQRGTEVYAETCPQYIFLNGGLLDQANRDAAVYMFSPPPRSPADNKFLWHGLESGRIALWSSDHSPYDLSSKLPEGDNTSFSRAVSGVPGLETRLPLLFSEGLVTNRLSLKRYLDLTSGNAASLYGMDQQKGSIAVGFDADLVLWDPTIRWTINQPVLHSNVDFTPFEGHTVTGKPATVLLRGKPVILDGKLTEEQPFGHFLHRVPAPQSAFTIPVEETQPWRVN